MRVLAARVISCVLVSGALAALVACEPGKMVTPTNPSLNPTGQPVLTVWGTTTLNQPGDTAQLTATINAPDGSLRDVTRVADWSSTGTTVTVSGGLVTATGYGHTTVSAVAEGLRGSTGVTVLPAGMVFLNGSVVGPDGPVVGAQVEVSSPSRVVSGTTNQWGGFALPALGQATVRVKMAGYQDGVKQLTVDKETSVSFILLREGDAPGKINGPYTLTFTASPSCALPPEAMRRIYAADIVEGRLIHRPEDLVVRLSGADFIGWANDAGFTGRLDGSTVRFDIGDDIMADYAVIEAFHGMTMHYLGTATGTVSDKAIVTTFVGTVVVDPIGQCTASDHSLVLTR